jgi:hypothetical protein
VILYTDGTFLYTGRARSSPAMIYCSRHGIEAELYWKDEVQEKHEQACILMWRLVNGQRGTEATIPPYRFWCRRPLASDRKFIGFWQFGAPPASSSNLFWPLRLRVLYCTSAMVRSCRASSVTMISFQLRFPCIQSGGGAS